MIIRISGYFSIKTKKKVENEITSDKLFSLESCYFYQFSEFFHITVCLDENETQPLMITVDIMVQC